MKSVRERAFLVSVACLFSGTAVAAVAVAQRLPYPNTPGGSISDSYFGTIVKDPYRWLEDGNDPAVKAWALAQTSLAQKYLSATPSFAAYKQRIATLSRTSTQRFRLVVRGERLIYERQTPPQQQPQLIARDGLTGAERVLFDPEQSAGSGPAPAIESIAVSPDGSKVAFTTQLGGSENETVRFVDATTTGENDPRVEPYMSRKMVAMLQADTSSANPILLIQRAGQGHGIGNSFDQQIESATDEDAFFDSQLR